MRRKKIRKNNLWNNFFIFCVIFAIGCLASGFVYVSCNRTARINTSNPLQDNKIEIYCEKQKSDFSSDFMYSFEASNAFYICRKTILRLKPNINKELLDIISWNITQSCIYLGKPELVRIIATQMFFESSFRPNAKGKHGEIGLMQIKPSTASYITGLPISESSLYDIPTNVFIGTLILVNYLEQYGNLRVALSRYNGIGHRSHLYAEKILSSVEELS